VQLPVAAHHAPKPVSKNHLAFALDFPSFEDAQPLLAPLAEHVGFAKIGLELFTHDGPSAVRGAIDAGFDVFLDLKLHDIPATVERAVANAASLGVRLLTVHTAGGPAMLARAVEAAHKAGSTQVVGVTVLTSLDAADLAATGVTGSPADQALRLATMAWNAGVSAFVCSPKEVARLRSALGNDATLITPGIRPSGAATQDQKRVATPASAIADGADILVVGRPIRDAASPTLAAQAIVDEIARALRARPRT